MGRRGAPRGGTPAVRAAEAAGVPFTLREYEHDPRTTAYGDEVVARLGLPPETVFKTLLAEVDGDHVVAVLPVPARLDLKALAGATGGKRARMAPPADAERVTGYVVGGMSPLGQRRTLPTVVDVSVEGLPAVRVSAGRRGLQMEVAPEDLIRLTGAVVAAITA